MRPLHLILPAFFVVASLSVSAAEGLIDFNRDVRPILSDKCFKCHGPDAENQKSDFRLDTREKALKDLGGVFGIVPGKVKDSDLHWRIWEEGEDLMPPAKSKLALTDAEKKTLDQWIVEGAHYDEHWSFKPIQRPALPPLSPNNQRWSVNAIDSFIAARLEREKLSPSPRAEKEALIRRATLDLTGLPPTLAEVSAFVADKDPAAWERVVDRLLASPRYGERMALVWLDAARYADSGGYQNDIRRTQWPWRDWVIKAYNDNKPFDVFTIEQLAGDLLDNATDEQRLATAFNRNHRINNEGGIIPEEYLAEYIADRVETTSTVWLGLTMGCARCHDHKYDPLAQKDFYRMSAFFNSIPEKGSDGDTSPKPNMVVYHQGTAAEHAALKERVAESVKRLKVWDEEGGGRFADWLQAEELAHRDLLVAVRKIPAPSLHIPFDTVENKRNEKRQTPDIRQPDRKVLLIDENKNYKFLEASNFGSALAIKKSTLAEIFQPHAGGFDSSLARSWLVHLHAPKNFSGGEGPVLACLQVDTLRGYRLMLENAGDPKFYRLSFGIIDDINTKRRLEVVSTDSIPKDQWSRLAVTWDGSGRAAGLKFYLNGRALETTTVHDSLEAKVTNAENLLVGARNLLDAKGQLFDATLNNGAIDDLQIYDQALDGDQLLLLSEADPQYSMLAHLEPSPKAALRNLWLNNTPEAKQMAKEQAEQEVALAAFEKEHVVEVSIMEEMAKPRDAYLLVRGAYDQPDTKEKLTPGVPGVLPPMQASLPRNRLGLARWIMDARNPLTARVAINHYWQMYFGIGLVKTPEDFGAQGAGPSHPELLDWLAAEFHANGWNVKAMQKLIVMSATYQQSSRVNQSLLEKDPENRLLARGPRFRLNGQALRDQALAVAGLMAGPVGGPSVMPYQPEGLWDEVDAKGYKYIEGSGADLYRRSMYTFWRRTVPPPSMMNFDSATREVCSVRLSSTNTPLQALNLMNDPQFMEAARALGQRMMVEGGPAIADQITFGHRVVLARPPHQPALAILQASYGDYLDYYSRSPDKAQELISVGASKPGAQLAPPQLAAMTMIASVILNLDETVTKQ